MKIKRVVTTIIALLIILFTLTIRINATTIDPNDYRPDPITNSEVQEIVDMSAVIISVIRTVGTIVAVVMLLVLGIKYMTGSLEERADYKKSMIPYLVGAFIFFALSQILAVIIQLVNSLGN